MCLYVCVFFKNSLNMVIDYTISIQNKPKGNITEHQKEKEILVTVS